MHRFRAVLMARNMEFLRDRSSLGWNILLPVLLVLGLALVFSGGERPLFKVGIVGDPAAVDYLDRHEIQRIPVRDIDDAVRKVGRHQLDMLLDPAEERFWVNPTSGKGSVLASLLKAEVGQRLTREPVAGEALRYIDWAVPGILGMNMMFSCLWGVGYVVVRYRKNGFLKRLNATPLNAFEFVSAQVASRMLLIMVITVGAYIGTDWFLDFRMEGSYAALFVIAALGASAMVALSLAVSARVSSEELAGGLLNLITWPMMVLSGVFFSMEGMNPWLRDLAKAFPLTQMLDGARIIMLEGGGFAEASLQIAALLLMTVAFLALGAALFKWQPD